MMAIDLVMNRHKKIQNMDLNRMSEYFAIRLGLCCHTRKINNPCHIRKSCTQCWKEFLQGSDT